MYSSSEINSERQVQIFKEEAKKYNLSVREATVSNVNDIQQAAQSLVGKVDLIYTPTDNTIASAVPALIKITEKAKLPVFAGEGGEVKGGATAAIAIDYYELGKIAGTMAAEILEGKAKPETMPIQYQKNFKTVFNEASVKNLGLTIPADVKHELVKYQSSDNVRLVLSTVSQGLLWAIMALGVFLTFRVLDIADLSVEGTFPLGAAVAATLIDAGHSVWFAMLIALIAGCIGGTVTALLTTKLKIPALLSGILTMIGLYSVNLMIMGKRQRPPCSAQKPSLR